MNAEGNGELPEGWARATLGELVKPSSEKVEPSERPEATYLSLEHIEPHTGAIIGRGRGSAVNSTKAVFRSGDVLYGKLRPYLNKVAVPDFDGICSTDILVFRQQPGIEARLLRYFLSTPAVVEFANHNSTGVQLPRIGFEALGTLELPLPPLAEQRRIVAAVEAVLARANAARERLGRVPAVLKRFRQAVLSAACSGRLTADWREQNPTTPPAGDWVQAIQQARIGTDEGRKLTKFAVPLMEAPAEADLANWVITRVGDVSECLDNLRQPIRKDHRGDEGTIPYYGANGRTGWINRHLFDEDLVLVVEDESFIGRERPFSYVIRGKAWVNNHAHVLRPLGAMPADYLHILLAYYDFVPLTSGTTGRRKLNQAALVAAPLAIAPLAEQQEIVQRVGELFALADVIEARLADARRMVDQLAQAVLAKAFRGELVPTEAALARRENRTYEPAADLLARVRTERQQPAAPTRPKPNRVQRPGRAVEPKPTRVPKAVRLQRALILAYFTHRQPTPGKLNRTRAIKLAAFAQWHFGTDLALAPSRSERGPYDRAIEQVEVDAAKAEFIEAYQQPKDGGSFAVRYRPGPMIVGAAGKAQALFGDWPAVDEFLGRAFELSTDDVELFGTVYAAWNDLLLDGRPADDAAIVAEVHGWHPGKRNKFTAPAVHRMLARIREWGYVPKGTAPRTLAALQHDHEPADPPRT